MSSGSNNAGGAGWLLIFIACGISVIPVFGFGSWLIAGPMLLAAFILSIVSLAKNGTGIFLLLAAAIAAPAFIVCAPIITTAAFGASQRKKAIEQMETKDKESVHLRAETTPRPIPQASTEARARAVKVFPDLARSGSLINRQFLERFERYQRTQPEFFDNPEWPTALARDCALGR